MNSGGPDLRADMQSDAIFGATRRNRPIGVCPQCRAVTRKFEQLDKKCGRPLALGAKCPGVIRSALTADEWMECGECRATGHVDDRVCPRCNGEGWLYDKRPLTA